MELIAASITALLAAIAGFMAGRLTFHEAEIYEEGWTDGWNASCEVSIRGVKPDHIFTAEELNAN